MLSSMTGFGRAVLDVPFGKITVEIQSVNRKFLEVFVSLPKELSRFEPEVRKWIGDAVTRGGVSVRIYLVPNSGSVEQLLPDIELLKGLKQRWEKIAHALKVDAGTIDLPFIMQNFPAASRGEWAKEEDLPSLQQCVKEALEGLLKMKKVEGKNLGDDLLKRLMGLEKKIGEIEKHSPDATAKMRQRLFEKMEEILKMGPEVEERLLREVALFAERVDITEEIIRLKSHISQFKEVLKGDFVGRKMDFLIQEIGREINTIGAKSSEAKISHLVVDLKSELEKMREQVQNIE